MENVVYLVIFVALAATAYGRFVATRNAALLADAERGHNLLENLILALVCFLCLVMTAELFLQWEPWLTPTDALWNMTPAVLWSVGMFIARQHPLDRTSVGTGLAALLPHVYQTLLAEMQLVSACLSVLCVVVAMVVAVRREPATQP
jgi:RsiW-degrading membrane proteinase PrsW (M82 family)